MGVWWERRKGQANPFQREAQKIADLSSHGPLFPPSLASPLSSSRVTITVETSLLKLALPSLGSTEIDRDPDRAAFPASCPQTTSTFSKFAKDTQRW